VSYATVELPSSVAAQIDAGVRDLPLDAVPAAAALEPGRPVALVHAGAPHGLGACDPENRRLRVYAAPGEPFRALDARFFAARAAAAVARRAGLGLPAADTNVYRLIHGAGDGLPGLAADRLGDHAVVYAPSRGLLALARLAAEALVPAAGLRGAVLKLRDRGGAARAAPRQSFVGAAPPERLTVHERGVPFEVHPLAGLNVGLFTDMREHRHALAARAAGRRVLNLFAYTGSLSVSCARAGAETTTVDLSAGVLAWAKDNFRLSGLDPSPPRHRFEADDAARFLARAAREGRRFELVLLDPPTFSAARGASFQLERDLPALVAGAAALLAPGGLVWLAKNTRGAPLDALAAAGFERAGRAATLVERGGLPPDYPTLAAQPDDAYLQVRVYARA
jgi:23S rRNA (cytosine1962-C5)-methyltransferase